MKHFISKIHSKEKIRKQILRRDDRMKEEDSRAPIPALIIHKQIPSQHFVDENLEEAKMFLRDDFFSSVVLIASGWIMAEKLQETRCLSRSTLSMKLL